MPPTKGNPSRLTPAVRARLLELAGRVLVSWSVFARYAGVNVRTFSRWRKMAEQGEEGYAELFAEINRLQAQVEVRLNGVVQDAGYGTWDDGRKEWIDRPQWAAAQTALERWKPSEYSTIAKLREEKDQAAAETSKESRLAQLAQHWQRTRPSDDG